MATFAFFPAREEQRRGDQLNFALAVGASAAAARVVAETLLGEPNALVGWTSVDLTSAPAAFVGGLPVGAKAQAVWPNLDRGGSYMKGALTMAPSRDPATVELARRNEAYWARLSLLFAGRPVVQVKDLLLEAGLSNAGHPYVEEHYANKLMRLGYRPVIIPALSGRLGVLIFVREPWPLDAHAGAIHPRLLAYLEDGDPLMALLVYRAQRDSMPREFQ